MSLLRGLANPFRSYVQALKVEVQLNLALVRFPTLKVDRPSLWEFDTLRALDFGKNVYVGPFTEIIAFSRSPRSRVPGKLILGDRVILTAGCNVRAAGGVIQIGANSGIGQGTVLVASHHAVTPGKLYVYSEWDETTTGVTIGSNCWLGAGCVVLPGVSIGDNAVVGAGSVVTKSLPPGELWAGAPARFLRKIT